MKVPPKTAQRAYAVASFIITSLRFNDDKDAALARVHLQAVRAMKVFAHKSPKPWFDEFINKLGDFWEAAGVKYDMKIEIKDSDVLVEALCCILPPKEFKSFFATSPYETKKSESSSEFRKACFIAAELSDMLNDFLGTKPAFVDLPKKKKVKEKKPRPKSKKQKLHEKRQAEAIEAKKKKEEVRQKLKDIVAAAKAKAAAMEAKNDD